MKSAAFLAALLLTTATAQAEEAVQHAPAAAPSSSATAAPSDLLALCPPDMPPACACVAQGTGVRVMPANEAYKSRLKVLLVGPKK